MIQVCFCNALIVCISNKYIIFAVGFNIGNMENEIIEKVKSTANIVDVVGRYLELVKDGRGYKCRCPFHDDHHPSMTVDPQKNFCYCFVCNEGGNPIKFVEKYRKVGFIDAIKEIAEIYHIDTNDYRRPREMSMEEQHEYRAKRRMIFVADMLAKSFSNFLLTSSYAKKALDYLKNDRGFSDEMIERYRLGFSSELNYFHVKEMRSSYISAAELESIGGVYTDQMDGQVYDSFTNRVVFPIQNHKGEVVGFAGRSLGDKLPKYKNTKNTAIYNKSGILYGLYQAKDEILAKGEVYITEGYCDVISMAQKGVGNVVASCGTAFTSEHASLLKTYCKRVILMYDGDGAGMKANMAAGKMLLDTGFDVRIVVLPEGEDPDSFAISHTESELKEYLATNSKLFLLHLAERLKDHVDSDDAERNKVLSDVYYILQKVGHNI